MSALMPYGYYNRFDENKKFEKHLFVAGAGLQSAELNEIQEYSLSRVRSLGDALFKDGDIVRDAQIVVNASTGYVKAQSGALYVAGAVRGIAPRNFSISKTGEVMVGVYLVESVVTAVEDTTLLDPAAGTRNYMEPGASRLKLDIVWGFDGERSDADFFPVYVVRDGYLSPKSTPPAMEAVNQAIASYDRDSSGGSYVVAGLKSSKLNDSAGKQVYSVAAGKARVRGYGIEFKAATRLVIDPAPELLFIDSEPQLCTASVGQVIPLDRYPVANVTDVKITKETTITLTHGLYSGAADVIPDQSILSIESVTQGAKTYVQGTDYKLTAGKVDWSPAGAEPATGSTYTVVYRHITSVVPTEVTVSSCTVTGAVVGSLILVSYNQMLPRIDRIAITDDGDIVYVKGVSDEFTPQSPHVPPGMLPIATIVQTWDSKRKLINDGIRVVPMNEIADLGDRIDYALSLIAQQRLESDISVRDAGAKKGLFTDPFIDDSQRDQGIAQNAAIFDGIMTLPIDASERHFGNSQLVLVHDSEGTVLQQTARTGSMKVNPYMAFAPIPAEVTLTPSIDRWVDVKTTWSSPVTRTLVVGFFSAGLLQQVQSVSVNNQLLSSSVKVESELRQIDVQFSLSGFGPGETLTSVTFDGVSVTPVAI